MEIKEGFTIPILDHGYIKFIEHWGKDERVVESARMSTGKGFLRWDAGECPTCDGKGEFSRVVLTRQKEAKRVWTRDGKFSYDPPHKKEVVRDKCISCSGTGKVSGDLKLVKYLKEHRHTTPFELAGCVIEVQAPIMVFREWHRHRTQSYNEMSARYTPLPDINYIPTTERCLVVNKSNRQAGKIKDADELTHESVLEWLEELAVCYDHCEETYQSGLKRGIPKELARLCVPVGRYSRMRAQAILKNWLDFLTLRMDETAQYEIRQFANALGGILTKLFPRVMELFFENKPYKPLGLDSEVV